MNRIKITVEVLDKSLCEHQECKAFSHEVEGAILMLFPSKDPQDQQPSPDGTIAPERPFGFVGGIIDPNEAAANIIGIPEIGKIVFGTAFDLLLHAPVMDLDKLDLPDEVKAVLRQTFEAQMPEPTHCDECAYQEEPGKPGCDDEGCPYHPSKMNSENQPIPENVVPLQSFRHPVAE